jgi:hypothetical protein
VCACGLSVPGTGYQRIPPLKAYKGWNFEKFGRSHGQSSVKYLKTTIRLFWMPTKPVMKNNCKYSILFFFNF